jgi:hypothetical protein
MDVGPGAWQHYRIGDGKSKTLEKEAKMKHEEIPND